MRYLATSLDTLVHISQEVPLAHALRVANGGSVGSLSDEQVGLAAVHPRGAEVPIWRHVVVACVDHRLVAGLHVEHCSTQNLVPSNEAGAWGAGGELTWPA